MHATYMYTHGHIHVYVCTLYTYVCIYAHSVYMHMHIHAMISSKECQRSNVKYSINSEAKADSDYHRINF